MATKVRYSKYGIVRYKYGK